MTSYYGALRNSNEKNRPKNYNYKTSVQTDEEASIVDDKESYDEEIEEFTHNMPIHDIVNKRNSAPFSHALKSQKTKSQRFDDQMGEDVEDLFMKNGFFQTNGEFSAKKSSHQDCYFKNMNEFVDDKLQIIVDRLAEKKALQTANNTLRVLLDRCGDEIQKQLKEHAKLSESYDQEFQINKKINKEWDTLESTLANLRERIESVRISEHEAINNLREQQADLKNSNIYNEQRFNLDKNIWNDELKIQKDTCKDLEEDSRMAQSELKDLTLKHKYWVKLENEKTQVFKEKNKILNQLIEEERPTLKANTNKRVFDITKDFCKQLDQRKIAQSIDTKRGIIDLSSTKLFNTTLNSIKHSYLEKTYDNREAGKLSSANKRRSTGTPAKNVSHYSSHKYV